MIHFMLHRWLMDFNTTSLDSSLIQSHYNQLGHSLIQSFYAARISHTDSSFSSTCHWWTVWTDLSFSQPCVWWTSFSHELEWADKSIRLAVCGLCSLHLGFHRLRSTVGLDQICNTYMTTHLQHNMCTFGINLAWDSVKPAKPVWCPQQSQNGSLNLISIITIIPKPQKTQRQRVKTKWKR